MFEHPHNDYSLPIYDSYLYFKLVEIIYAKLQ